MSQSVNKKMEFEQLEDRRLLTIFTVNTLLDDGSGAVNGQTSLREAITAAETNLAFGDAVAGEADGDSIVFDASLTDQVFTLTGGQFNLTDDLTIGESTTRVTIDANQLSRIFHVNGSEDFTFRNMDLLNGRVGTSGGTIKSIGSGLVNLLKVKIENSHANDHGGAIQIDHANALLRMTDSQFFSNSAGIGSQIGNGGAIQVTGSTNIEAYSSQLVGNVSNGSGGAIWIDDGQLEMFNNSVLRNNMASGNLAGQGGGAAYSDSGVIRIQDSEVYYNVANGDLGAGGAIYSNDGKVNVRRSLIYTNLATVSGGAIEANNSVVQFLDSTVGGSDPIDANYAGLNGNSGLGGGVHLTGTNGNLFLQRTTLQNNNATAEGGAVWSSDEGFIVTSDNVMILNNQSTFGGAIFNQGRAVLISGTTFDANNAGGVDGWGGAIHSKSGNIILSQSDFTNNSAEGSGGAIALLGGLLTTNTVAFESNSAGENGGAIAAKLGETISDIVVIADNTEFTTNTAELEGGAIWSFGSDTDNPFKIVIRTGSKVIDNVARSADAMSGGGGIYATQSDVRILSSTVSGNSATGDQSAGGAVISQDGLLVSRDTLFSRNTAIKTGGAIQLITSVALFFDSTIGGTVPSEANLVGTFVPNVTGDGAGIHIVGASSVLVDGGQITTNTANGDGGGIWNDINSSLQIRNGTLVNGNSGKRGGAIFNASGSIALIGIQVHSNVATQSGGGLYLEETGTVQVDVADFLGNLGQTGEGGGVYNSGNLEFLNGGLFQNNAAGISGGAIFTSETGLTIEGDITFDGNHPDDTN